MLRQSAGLTIILASTLLLSGCSLAPEKNVDGLDVVRLDSQSNPLPTKTLDPQGQEYANDQSAEIDIEDQSGDGTTLEIDEIKVGRGDAFLVIYNASGLALAEVLVTPQSQPVTIRLTQALEKSQPLQAALYLDNGDGIFELDSDLPILGEEGKLVHADFDYTVTK